MFKYILIVFTIFLVGCSPKYVVKNEYVPLATEKFNVCVNQCEIQKTDCDNNCVVQYEKCIANAYVRAKDIVSIEMIKYSRDYDSYLLAMRDYRHYKYKFDRQYIKTNKDYDYFTHECKNKKDKYACKRKQELNILIRDMNRNKLRQPRSPRKPSFNQILNEQQSYCKKDCGCSSTFDRCYVGCGGEVIPYRLCVENCD